MMMVCCMNADNGRVMVPSSMMTCWFKVPESMKSELPPAVCPVYCSYCS